MCQQGDTVQMPVGGRVHDIDRCISHIVAALNAGGVPTRASCCGHGKSGNIALDDGRELLIAPDFATARLWERAIRQIAGGADEPPRGQDTKEIQMSEARIADVIGGFPSTGQNCEGCGKPLQIGNAWMTDGCPCNSRIGVNSMNERRWRLLMQLQQQQSLEIERLQSLLRMRIGQTFWLIERGTAQWWTGGPIHCWTRDVEKAVRFARRSDADAVILGRDTNASAWRDCDPFASQHLFLPPTSGDEPPKEVSNG